MLISVAFSPRSLPLPVPCFSSSSSSILGCTTLDVLRVLFCIGLDFLDGGVVTNLLQLQNTFLDKVINLYAKSI